MQSLKKIFNQLSLDRKILTLIVVEVAGFCIIGFVAVSQLRNVGKERIAIGFVILTLLVAVLLRYVIPGRGESCWGYAGEAVRLQLKCGIPGVDFRVIRRSKFLMTFIRSITRSETGARDSASD